MAPPLKEKSRSLLEPSLVTVILPIHREASDQLRTWLAGAIRSLPEGTPYIVAENDGDWQQAVNEAVESVDTEFVFPMGADDRLGRTFFDFLLSVSDGADVVYPSQTLTGPDMGEIIGRNPARPFCRHRLESINYVSGAALVRRTTWLEFGGFRDVDNLEDWDLWLRMSRAGKVFVPMPEADYFWRRHPESRSADIALGEAMNEYREQFVPNPVNPLATFVYQASYATSYLRCLLPSRYLPGQAWNWASFPMSFSEEEGEKRVDFPFVADNVVMQFPSDPSRLMTTWALQDEGRKVFVEMDDTYLLKGPVKDTHFADDAEGGFFSYEAHKRIVEEADGAITTTEHLAKQYRKFGVENVHVCPNMVDPSDWPESPWEDDGIFRIGWFASKSHYNDSRLVRRALEWAGKQDGVEVILMGVEPATFKKHVRYQQLPWSNDLRTYFQMLQMLDVGLAPVVETPWAACRSDLKALEYSMAGAMPLLSEATPYVNWTDGIGCFKTNDAKGFLRAVQWCVDNRDDVKELAAIAKDYVLKHRDISKNIDYWQEALDGSH